MSNTSLLHRDQVQTQTWMGTSWVHFSLTLPDKSVVTLQANVPDLISTVRVYNPRFLSFHVLFFLTNSDIRAISALFSFLHLQYFLQVQTVFIYPLQPHILYIT
jgi:hypothetical protein